MYKRIDFDNLGGNPVDQQSLELIQENVSSVFGGLAATFGNKVILTGVEVVGSVVTDGWITYNGEILKFVGGAIGTDVVITETVSYRPNFFDNTQHDEEIIKIATIGSAGVFPFSDLKPLNIGVPVGTVLMWSGDVTAIPTGFALCDGTGGTPNLSGKFIVGYDAADADYNTLANAGGEKEHTLASNEQGNIGAKATLDDLGGGGGPTMIARLSLNGIEVPMNGGANQSSYGTETTIALRATADAHENRPPYYTLAYIIKL